MPAVAREPEPPDLGTRPLLWLLVGMQSLVQYASTAFPEDLRRIQQAGDGRLGRRLSFVVFEPQPAPRRTPFRLQQLVYERVTDRAGFLQCLFHVVLFDQALHTASPAAHAARETMRPAPKYVGILGGFYSFNHPARLLGQAAQFAPPEELVERQGELTRAWLTWERQLYDSPQIGGQDASSGRILWRQVVRAATDGMSQPQSKGNLSLARATLDVLTGGAAPLV